MNGHYVLGKGGKRRPIMVSAGIHALIKERAVRYHTTIAEETYNIIKAGFLALERLEAATRDEAAYRVPSINRDLAFYSFNCLNIYLNTFKRKHNLLDQKDRKCVFRRKSGTIPT